MRNAEAKKMNSGKKGHIFQHQHKRKTNENGRMTKTKHARPSLSADSDTVAECTRSMSASWLKE